MTVRFLDGRTFSTWREAAKAYQTKNGRFLTECGLFKRCEKGQPPFGDVPVKRGRAGRKCYFRGKQYPSLSAAALANGMSPAGVYGSLKRRLNSLGE